MDRKAIVQGLYKKLKIREIATLSKCGLATVQRTKGSSAKYVIFPNRPSEALFPKNLTGIFHRGGIDQSLQSVSSLIDTIILGEANLGSIFEALSDEHVGNRGQHC